MTGHAGRTNTKRKRTALLPLLAGVAGAVAVVKELRLPRDQRRWHGSVAGVVPYDFRRPTAARARERLWAPDSPYIFTARVFGAGWTLNLGRVVELARRRLSRR